MLLHRKPLLKRERDCRRSSGDKRERKKIGALPFHLVTRDSWKRCDDHFVWRGNTAAKVSPKIPGRSTAKQELSSSSRAAHRYCENFSASSEARRKASSSRGNTFGKRCAAACAISCKRLRHQVSRQHLRPGSGDRRPRRSLLCELRHPVDERLPPSRGIHLPTPKKISARWVPLARRRPSALGFPSCRLGRRGSPSRCSDQPAAAPTMDRLLRFLQGSLLPENSGIRHRPPRLGQLAHLVRSPRPCPSSTCARAFAPSTRITTIPITQEENMGSGKAARRKRTSASWTTSGSTAPSRAPSISCGRANSA